MRVRFIGQTREALARLCSARWRGLGLTHYFCVDNVSPTDLIDLVLLIRIDQFLLIWINEFDAGVITRVEPFL